MIDGGADLSQVRLRSNPRFRLVPYDRLEVSERNSFASLSGDSDFFGVLIPEPDSGLPVKSVSRDAALLFLALTEPGCLPHLLASILGATAHQRLQQLVLDQVLEVEHAGHFVCGAVALKVFGDEPGDLPAARIAALSSAAIEHAATLKGLQVRQIADRLYQFNTIPSTPALQRRFALDEQVCSYLCWDNRPRGLLQSKWVFDVMDDGWLMWSDRTGAPANYKLYLSPTLDDLPAVFSVAVHAFAKTGCPRFKVGRGAYGVLRPDKVVAYFARLDALWRAAEMIEAGCAGANPQGVPFSGPIDRPGLLSWGMDPPRFEWAAHGYERPSWRRWLTERVAVYVTAARQSVAHPQSFVRQRIALDGVDPVNWAPNLSIWRDPVGAVQGAG